MSLLTIRKVAEELGVSTGRAYEIVRRGMLPGVRIGRQVKVSSAALERFIESGGQPLPPRDDA